MHYQDSDKSSTAVAMEHYSRLQSHKRKRREVELVEAVAESSEFIETENDTPREAENYDVTAGETENDSTAGETENDSDACTGSLSTNDVMLQTELSTSASTTMHTHITNSELSHAERELTRLQLSSQLLKQNQQMLLFYTGILQ